MLITKTVKVKWNGKNKENFISQGYEFTKIGDEFEVNVNDLSKGSHIQIEIKCDYCGKIIKRAYKTYYKLKIDFPTTKTDCCINCVGKKNKDFYLTNYGVESNMQLPEYKLLFKKNLNDIKIEFENRNYLLISDTYEYCTEKLEFVCNKHIDKGSQFISWTQFNRGFGCKYCGYEMVSEHHKGENNPNWKGGITPLALALREYTSPWKFDSLKEYDFKCVISGINDSNLEVHHLNKNFSEILYETFEILNIPLCSDMSNYSQNERELIKDKLLELHYFYGLGVPLTKDIHKKFHHIYGRHNNTPEQFEEFKQSYINNKSNIKVVR